MERYLNNKSTIKGKRKLCRKYWWEQYREYIFKTNVGWSTLSERFLRKLK